MSLEPICNKKEYVHTSGTRAQAYETLAFLSFLPSFTSLKILLPIFGLVPDARTYLSKIWGGRVLPLQPFRQQVRVLGPFPLQGGYMRF